MNMDITKSMVSMDIMKSMGNMDIMESMGNMDIMESMLKKEETTEIIVIVEIIIIKGAVYLGKMKRKITQQCPSTVLQQRVNRKDPLIATGNALTR